MENDMEWINVEDRLPELDDMGNSTWVLGAIQTSKDTQRHIIPVRIDYNRWVWVDGGKHISNGFYITHWMPLPEPPEQS